MFVDEEPMPINFRHWELLTMHTGQAYGFYSACASEDDIGVVLRVHLMLEKDLEAWCACASENGRFFAKFGENLNLSFAAKNQLAVNFGLSESLSKAIKRINKIRNQRAHQIDKFSLTESEIVSLRDLLEHDYPDNLLKIEDFNIDIKGTGLFQLNSKETPLRLKFVMLYAVLKMRMLDEAKRKVNSQL